MARVVAVATVFPYSFCTVFLISYKSLSMSRVPQNIFLDIEIGR